MKRLLCCFALFLPACGGNRISMDTPEKHAIAAFIVSAMSDPSTYYPVKLTRDSAFTRHDLLLMDAKTDAQIAGFVMDDSLDAAVSRRDSAAFNQSLARYAALRRRVMQLRLQSPGKKLGYFYTHKFYYDDKKGKEEYQEVCLRVYDSALVVKTLKGYNLGLL